MSLWTKPIDEIAFADIEAICASKPREGLRLDYKKQIPNDLAKLIAAFANTSGGLILLGIKAYIEQQDIPPQDGFTVTDEKL